MRRFALGALVYDPERFGNMLLGDFLDAMGGYNEAELERIKSLAELIRISTSMLWNVQVAEENKMSADQLWPLPWDKKEKVIPIEISEEDRKKIEEQQAEILNKYFPG